MTKTYTAGFLEILHAEIEDAILAQRENVQLREDRDYWRDKYQEMLTETIKHSEAVAGNMLMLALARPEVKP